MIKILADPERFGPKVFCQYFKDGLLSKGGEDLTVFNLLKGTK